MKRCSKCGEEKNENEFSKHGRSKDGLQQRCKACSNASNRARYEINKDKKLEQNKAWHEANKERHREMVKAHYAANKDKLLEQHKAWRDANREYMVEYQKAYRVTNREKIAARGRFYARRRRKSDPLFAATQRLRCLTWAAFKRKGLMKGSKSLEMLGCTAQELLEEWGVVTVPEGYHIDHICPLSQAQTIEELEKLCHHSNLRLLPAEENLRKGDIATEESVLKCKELLGRDWCGDC